MNGHPPNRGFGFPDRMIEVHQGWPGAWGWTIFALQLLLIAGVAWLILSMLLGRAGHGAAATAGAPAHAPQSAPLELLHMRYARGEIARDEYLQARADLSGEPAPPPAT